MSSKSYLYALELEVREDEIDSKQKLVKLSGFQKEIPLAYMILVSQDSRISNKRNTNKEPPIGIQGDFAKGSRKLFRFLNKLSEESIFDNTELQKQIIETKNFLSAHKFKNIALGCDEVFHTEDGKPGDQSQTFFENEILNINEKIKLDLEYFREMKAYIDSKKAEISILTVPKVSLINLFPSTGSNIFLDKDKVEELKMEVKNLEEEMWANLGINNWKKDLC